MKKKVLVAFFSVLFCVALAGCREGKDSPVSVGGEGQVMDSTTTAQETLHSDNVTTATTVSPTTNAVTTAATKVAVTTSGTTAGQMTASPTKPQIPEFSMSSVDSVPAGTAVSFAQGRVYLENGSEMDKIMIVKTVDEFQAVYDSERESYQSVRTETDLNNFPACYNEAFFEQNALVFVGGYLSASNIREQITGLTLTDNVLYVSYRREAIGEYGADQITPFRDFLTVKKSDIANVTEIRYFLDDRT